MKAKEFSLPDGEGNTRTLADYQGEWLVLYFYPADFTGGCTKEACGFRDSYSLYREKGVEVVGVSADTVESHQRFAAEHNLKFPLLSDEKMETIKAYGAWGKKERDGKEYMGILRKTYLIDPNGEVRKVYDQVDPVEHAGEILQDIEGLN